MIADDAPADSPAAAPAASLTNGGLWEAARRVGPIACLMFVQHVIGGAWVPILPLHLADLGFDNARLGTLFGILSIATIVSPWVTGQIADRLLPAQYLILLLDILSAGVLWLMASETHYWRIVAYLVVWQLLYMPTFALCNHVAFSQLRDGRRNFGYVRMFGTAGWVVGSLAIGWWLHKPDWLAIARGATLADGMRLAAIASLVAAGFSVILPMTPPARNAATRIAALGALGLLRRPDVAVLMAVTFVVSLTQPFVHPHGGLFLRTLGVSDAKIAPLLSLGQMVEVAAFLALAWLLTRFSFRAVFLIGLACWVLRFAIWTSGQPFWLVAVSMGLHGICYAYVLGLGMVYLDRRATPDIRSSAQSLHLVVAFGLGMWPANWLTAQIADAHLRVLPGGAAVVDYSQVFIYPLVVVLLCWIAFALAFREPRGEAESR
jgi:MFS family permease